MTDPTSVAVAAQQIGHDGQPLVEPGSFFVDGNYSLRVNSWNSVAGVVLGVRIRFLGADGRTTDSVELHTPNSNRSLATTIHPLAIGFPLNVMVFAVSGAPIIGRTFVQVQLVRGFSGALLPMATLLQNTVTAVQAVAWPGSPIVASTSIDGALISVAGAVPAAGAEILETVPTGARWEFITGRLVLTASAAVANRKINIIIRDLANVIYKTANANQLTASQTGDVSLSPNTPYVFDAVLQFMQLPVPQPTRLLAAFTIGTSTTGIQAADQYSAFEYVIREQLEAAS